MRRLRAKRLLALFALSDVTMTDPFRMAAVLIYGQNIEAEFYAERRYCEASQGGDAVMAAWWADVVNAIIALRAQPPLSHDEVIN